MPLHHVVLIKLVGGAEGPAAEKIDPLIRTLVETVPGVLTRETASDLNLRPGNERSYQRMLHLTFADAAAWRAYADTPEHQAFLSAASDLIESLGSIQYHGD